MFNRLSLSILATSAVLATTALSPTPAAAHGGGGYGGGYGGWGHRWGGWRGYGYYRPCWRNPYCNDMSYYGGGDYSAPATARDDPQR